MKILKQGKDYDKRWIGTELTCGFCGCKFELTAEDKDRVKEGGRNEDALIVNCPCCRKGIGFNPPIK